MNFHSKTFLTGKKPVTILLFLLYVIASIIGAIHHEFWRDELQAWMVARDADNFINLFSNLKYEGNPALWHILLFILTRFTNSPYSMVVLHLAISFSFVFIFLTQSNFSILQKFLFISGYFILFEYNLISRGYGLGVFLVFLIIYLYRNKSKNLFYIFILLALLANTTIFGLIISGAFVCLILFEAFIEEKTFQKQITKKKIIEKQKLIFHWPELNPAFYIGIIIFITGTVLSIIQIYPEPDNSFPVNYPQPLFNMERLNFLSFSAINAYIPIPDFSSTHFWNYDFINWSSFDYTPLVFFLIVITGFCSMLHKRKASLFFLTGTAVLAFFYYYSALVWWRYTGYLFIVFISSFWLKEYFPDTKYNSRLLNWLSVFGKKISVVFLTIVLLIHSIGGILAYSKDLKQQFSAGEETVDYLVKEKLAHLPIIGHTDFLVSIIPGLLDKPIFYISRQEYGSFIIYDQKRKLEINNGDIIKSVNTVSQSEQDSFLMILGKQPLMDSKTNTIYDEGWFNENLTYKLIKSFDEKIIVADEVFYIYLMEKKNYYSSQ